MQYAIKLVCFATICLQASKFTLANPASSSKGVSFNDDNADEWFKNWSIKNDEVRSKDLEEDDADPSLLYSDSEEAPSTSQAPPKYKVDLNANRYWQKYQEALANNDQERAKKNQEKYQILGDNDIQGMKRLVERYIREHQDLGAEYINHRCNGECARHSSELWINLACALSRDKKEPIGMQVNSSMTAEEVRRYRADLYRQAQYEASELISKGRIPDAEFNLNLSEGRLAGKRARDRSMRDEKSRRKLEKAMKLHDHRINALLHRNVDDANALASYYGDKARKYSKKLEEIKAKEAKVATRRHAWRKRVEKVQSQRGH